MSRILITPLSWGLGHATRCIPIIKKLLMENHEVSIGACGNAFKLLQREFPRCHHIFFNDYPAPYSSSTYFLPKFVANIPLLLTYLSEERDNIEKIINDNDFDMIISDNRMGVYSKDIPSLFITHQLRYSMPDYLKPFEDASLHINEYIHKKFDAVIIPDSFENSLSGKLCHSPLEITNSKTYYTGILSSSYRTYEALDLDYLVVVSGPEPQRKILEEIIMKQITSLDGKKVVILGNPNVDVRGVLEDGTIVRSFVSEEEKLSLMNRAKFIISRSGYTTMMDMAELDKRKGLFIPTPGQTEQEYLSKYYQKMGWFYSNNQYDLNLVKDVKMAREYTGFPPFSNTKTNVNALYENVIKKYL